MMTSSGDNSGRVGVWVCSPTKLKIPKAEQETAQPTAARFNNLQLLILSCSSYGIIESSPYFYTVRFDVPFERYSAHVPNLFIDK